MLAVTNTLTRAKEPLRPRTPGRVTMYTCGPTVYRSAHIGNLRTFLLADLLRRALEADGTQVRQVQNITDVGHMVDEQFDRGEDRMLVSARLEDKSPAEIAAHYTEAFLADAAAFNLQPAADYPRASEYVPQMQDLVARLLEGGHAYEVEGNVYFAVESFPGYGRLSGNTLERLRAGHRQEEPDPRKRHHADFALWKAAGPGRLVKWPSPWGDGYPGWHIECHVPGHPGRAHRRPHRRRGQRLPPPRGRDRPVRGGGRPPRGDHLGPRPAPADRGLQDVQVQGQLPVPAGADRPGPQPPGRPAAVPPGPLPLAAQLHLGRPGRGRADPGAAALAHGRLGQGPRRPGPWRRRGRRRLRATFLGRRARRSRHPDRPGRPPRAGGRRVADPGGPLDRRAELRPVPRPRPGRRGRPGPARRGRGPDRRARGRPGGPRLRRRRPPPGPAVRHGGRGHRHPLRDQLAAAPLIPAVACRVVVCCKGHPTRALERDDGTDAAVLEHLQGQSLEDPRQVRGPEGDPRLLLRAHPGDAPEDAPGRGRRGHLAQAHRAPGPAAPAVGGQAGGAGPAGRLPEPRGPSPGGPDPPPGHRHPAHRPPGPARPAQGRGGADGRSLPAPPG